MKEYPRFRHLNVGDKLYFVEVKSNEGFGMFNQVKRIAMTEAEITAISFTEDNYIKFENNHINFKVNGQTLLNESGTILKDSNIYIFTTKEEARNQAYKLINEINKMVATDTVNEKKEEDENPVTPHKQYEWDDFADLSEDEIKEAAKNMTPGDLGRILATGLVRFLGALKDAVAADNEEKEEEPVEEVNETCLNHCPDHDCNKHPYVAPTAEEYTAPKSVPALLGIHVTQSGVEKLNKDYYADQNPLFDSPVIFFHHILIPDLDPRTDGGNEVEPVYEAIEKWIDEKYPEFAQLDYSDDYYYDIYPASAVSVCDVDDPIDFNVYAYPNS